MSIYHQMGHHTFNLINTPELNKFRGAILSPVNYTEEEILSKADRGKENFKWIFDPQLYFPHTERQRLRSWAYFPSDVDTADLSNLAWWDGIINKINETCRRLNIKDLCSPAFLPGLYNNEYYSLMVQLCEQQTNQLKGTSIKSYQTVIINLTDLIDENRPFEIATILSRTKANNLYLIFISNTTPRRELSNSDELKGGMKLINLLKRSGLKTIIGFCSSEFLLWKAAGADICTTGKFFNLRRFTSSRFDEPSEGGGQLPYYFDQTILGFFRETDVIRLKKADILSHTKNPYNELIFCTIEKGEGNPWLAHSWRQFMFAFADLNQEIESGVLDIEEALIKAEKKWIEIDDNKILMEEMRNDGSWVRTWRRAYIEYRQQFK